MEYRTLGKTGLKVSLVSLGSGGTRKLGQDSQMNQESQTFLVRKALNLGINLIDTSAQYGDSEAILGKALKEFSRDSYLICTKWYSANKLDPIESPKLLIKSIENSLSKLNTDRIDIMMFHGPLQEEYRDIIELCYPILDFLREQGKIRFIGLSTRFALDPEQIVAELALKNNPELFDVIMLKYGILNQHAAKTIMPLAIKNNLGIMNMAVIREKFWVYSLNQNLFFVIVFPNIPYNLRKLIGLKQLSSMDFPIIRKVLSHQFYFLYLKNKKNLNPYTLKNMLN